MKNAGNALSAINAGTMTLSTAPPRRQAAIMPIGVPITNARKNAMPTSKIE